ncbi:hypothetical protein EMIT0347P_40653 [Pseudomonas sp. IT-347P]
MGAGLLAKAVCHSTMMSTDTANSRASSLPQGMCQHLNELFDALQQLFALFHRFNSV